MSALLLLYDGGCGLCSRTVRVVRALDWRGRVSFVDFHAEWDQLAREHPSLDAEACAAAMHVIARSGRVSAGFDAVRMLAWVLPAGWPIVLFLYLPGVPFIGRRVYRAIAANRHAICTLPAAPRAGR